VSRREVFGEEMSLTKAVEGERKEIIIMAESESRKALNVVLVHGGFVDGSGWEGVYQILKKKGYKVSVVQNPTISLADDGTGRLGLFHRNQLRRRRFRRPEF
jgi:hypothetical protein